MTRTQRTKLAIIEDFIDAMLPDDNKKPTLKKKAFKYIAEILKDEKTITENNCKPIQIPFTFQELQRLLDGESFDWTFNGIDIHLFNEEMEMYVQHE